MQDIEYPLVVTRRLRPQFIVFIALTLLIVALGLTNVFYGLHSSHSRPIYPLEQKQLSAQLAAARSPQPPEDQWVESRDGDGALDVEDINGPATIYFDTQTHTRLLCVENTGCYHLRGRHEGKK